MHFVLIGPQVEENLGIGYLAASLREGGHQVTVLAFDGEHEIPALAAKTAALDARAVGLAMAYQPGARAVMSLAGAIRDAGFTGHLTAGGQFASIAADALLRDCAALDSILCGEAESSIVQLANALAAGGALAAVPGIVLRGVAGPARGPRAVKPADLDALPFPARDQAAQAFLGVPMAALVASRGCRGHCTYCSIAAFGRLSSGAARRERSPGNVAREIAQLARERSARFFVFQDDDFLRGDERADVAWMAELKSLLGARAAPLAFAIKARPDDLGPEVMRALAELGVVQVFLGVETVAENGLRALGRGLSPEANVRGLSLLCRAGMHVAANLLLWEPDTSLGDVRANLRLMAELPEQLFNFGRTEPYEGAPLTTRLARAGRLRGGYLRWDYQCADPQAELSWRLFQRTLAARTREAGSIVVGQKAGLSAALAQRLFASREVNRLANRTRKAVQRLAGSNREALERIVELSSRLAIDEAQAIDAAALRLGDELRREEVELLAGLGGCLAELQAWARRPGDSKPARSLHAGVSPSRRARRHLPLALAGAVACAHAGPAETREATSHEARPDCKDTNVVVSARKPEVQFSVYARAGRLSSLQSSDGSPLRAVVDPRGSMAQGTLPAARAREERKLAVVLRGEGGERRCKLSLTAEEGLLDHSWLKRPGCDPVGDMPEACTPNPSTREFLLRYVLGEFGPLKVWTAWTGPWSFASKVDVTIGLPDDPDAVLTKLDLQADLGILAEVDMANEPAPAIHCETNNGCGATNERTLPAEGLTRNYLHLRWDPYPATGITWLREGPLELRVKVQVATPDGKRTVLEARPKMTINADGSVQIPLPAGSTP